jgi:hypothetical protein
MAFIQLFIGKKNGKKLLNKNMSGSDSRKELVEAEKWAIVAYSNFYRNEISLRLDSSGLDVLASKFSLSKRRIGQICEEYTSQVKNTLYPTLIPQKKGKVGRKMSLTEEISDAMIEINQKTKGQLTNRALLLEFNKDRVEKLSYSTFFRYLIEIGFYNVDSYLKPSLTYEQQIKRLEFVLSKIEHVGNGNYRFIQLKNVIHIDEKWFFLVKMQKTIRMYPGDDYPGDDTTHHKSHIPKIMFLCAVGTPHEISPGQMFDGKIGLWPFVEWERAKRTSKNRVKGTRELKGVNVTAERYYDVMTKDDGVISSIKKKMGHLKNVTITIQQDGAKPHTGYNNVDLLNAFGHRNGWTIEFETQPPQSPDLNKLDLCFFHSLQCQADALKSGTNTLDNMIKRVSKAYKDYDIGQLERVNALMYVVYRCILQNDGHNQYDMPHTGIRNRQNNGITVEDRTVDGDVVRAARRLVDAYRTPN